MRLARTWLPACMALVAALLLPVSAQAVTPARQPAPLATVDHPPVDGVNSFDNGSRDVPRVALTFDADMTQGMLAQLRSGQVRSWYNREVRDILDAEGVRATMFLTGLWVQAYPDVARSLAHDPLFEIGSHTYDHAAFRTPCYSLPAAADRTGEIVRAQEQIEAAAGVRPTLLRFPGDCYDRSDVALARQLGLSVISGDVRSGDAFNTSAASVTAVVLRNLKPGSIVLMHLHGGPNAPMTAPALRGIIQGARARGLGFGTVSQVLGWPDQPLAAPPTARQLLEPLRALKLEWPGRADQVLAPYRLRRLRGPRSPGRGLPGQPVQ